MKRKILSLLLVSLISIQAILPTSLVFATEQTVIQFDKTISDYNEDGIDINLDDVQISSDLLEGFDNIDINTGDTEYYDTSGNRIIDNDTIQNANVKSVSLSPTSYKETSEDSVSVTVNVRVTLDVDITINLPTVYPAIANVISINNILPQEYYRPSWDDVSDSLVGYVEMNIPVGSLNTQFWNSTYVPNIEAELPYDVDLDSLETLGKDALIYQQTYNPKEILTPNDSTPALDVVLPQEDRITRDYAIMLLYKACGMSHDVFHVYSGNMNMLPDTTTGKIPSEVGNYYYNADLSNYQIEVFVDNSDVEVYQDMYTADFGTPDLTNTTFDNVDEWFKEPLSLEEFYILAYDFMMRYTDEPNYDNRELGVLVELYGSAIPKGMSYTGKWDTLQLVARGIIDNSMTADVQDYATINDCLKVASRIKEPNKRVDLKTINLTLGIDDIETLNEFNFGNDYGYERDVNVNFIDMPDTKIVPSTMYYTYYLKDNNTSFTDAQGRDISSSSIYLEWLDSFDSLSSDVFNYDGMVYLPESNEMYHKIEIATPKAFESIVGESVDDYYDDIITGNKYLKEVLTSQDEKSFVINSEGGSDNPRFWTVPVNGGGGIYTPYYNSEENYVSYHKTATLDSYGLDGYDIDNSLEVDFSSSDFEKLYPVNRPEGNAMVQTVKDDTDNFIDLSSDDDSSISAEIDGSNVDVNVTTGNSEDNGSYKLTAEDINNIQMSYNTTVIGNTQSILEIPQNSEANLYSMPNSMLVFDGTPMYSVTTVNTIDKALQSSSSTSRGLLSRLFTSTVYADEFSSYLDQVTDYFQIDDSSDIYGPQQVENNISQGDVISSTGTISTYQTFISSDSYYNVQDLIDAGIFTTDVTVDNSTMDNGILLTLHPSLGGKIVLQQSDTQTRIVKQTLITDYSGTDTKLIISSEPGVYTDDLSTLYINGAVLYGEAGIYSSKSSEGSAMSYNYDTTNGVMNQESQYINILSSNDTTDDCVIETTPIYNSYISATDGNTWSNQSISYISNSTTDDTDRLIPMSQSNFDFANWVQITNVGANRSGLLYLYPEKVLQSNSNLNKFSSDLPIDVFKFDDTWDYLYFDLDKSAKDKNYTYKDGIGFMFSTNNVGPTFNYDTYTNVNNMTTTDILNADGNTITVLDNPPALPISLVANSEENKVSNEDWGTEQYVYQSFNANKYDKLEYGSKVYYSSNGRDEMYYTKPNDYAGASPVDITDDYYDYSVQSEAAVQSGLLASGVGGTLINDPVDIVGALMGSNTLRLGNLYYGTSLITSLADLAVNDTNDITHIKSLVLDNIKASPMSLVTISPKESNIYNGNISVLLSDDISGVTLTKSNYNNGTTVLTDYEVQPEKESELFFMNFNLSMLSSWLQDLIYWGCAFVFIITPILIILLATTVFLCAFLKDYKIVQVFMNKFDIVRILTLGRSSFEEITILRAMKLIILSGIVSALLYNGAIINIIYWLLLCVQTIVNLV